MQIKKQEKHLIKQINELTDQYLGLVGAQACAHDRLHKEKDSSKRDTIQFRIHNLENKEIICTLQMRELLDAFFELNPTDKVYIARFNFLRSSIGSGYKSERIIEAMNQKCQELKEQSNKYRTHNYYHQEFMWNKRLNAALSNYFLNHKSKDGMYPKQAARFSEFTDLLQTVCERHCELRDNYAMPVSQFDQFRQKITKTLESIKKSLGR